MTAARARAVASVVPTLGRVVALATLDHLTTGSGLKNHNVPRSPEAITPAWLTAALCRDAPGARVTSVTVSGGSSGTTYRRALDVTYNDAGTSAGLPARLFSKSSPGVLQRLTQAVTGPVEAQFYVHIRPTLELEAPRCFHGVIDERRMAAITLLEDLVATKQAEFLSPATVVSRAEAEQVVRTLATLHATFAGRPPAFPKTYQSMWGTAHALMGIERYFLRCFEEADDGLIEPSIRAAPQRAWQSVLDSIAIHDRLAPTLLHNDVHLGNWYRTGDGRMGLCDWQAVVRGHWSRDLAYALATTLTIDDRRAYERELIALYLDELASRGGPRVAFDEALDLFRGQLWGALAFWAPTYSPPRLMPSDMQPRSVSGELLRRISAALADHAA